MKKKRIVTIAVVSTLLLGAPAVAQFVPDDSFGVLAEDLEELLAVDYEELFDKGEAAVEAVAELFDEFSWNGLGDAAEAIAGVFGIPIPTEVKVSADTIDPIYPEQSYVIQNENEHLSSRQVQDFTNSILGIDGQQLMATDIQTSSMNAALSQELMDQVAEQSKQSDELAGAVEESAETMKGAAGEAQKKESSHEVLKIISEQLAEDGAISVAKSQQAATLSSQAASQSAQLAAIASSANSSNNFLNALVIGQAYSSKEISNINHALTQLNEAQRDEQRRQSTQTSQAIDLYYFPALVNE
jgi:hypothetical protein